MAASNKMKSISTLLRTSEGGLTIHKNMREIEQDSDDQFAVKSVCKGAQSEAVLLFLNPGQEMPSYPHERFEVVLVPHIG